MPSTMTIWESIANTSWWYFVFYGYLAWICMLSIKPLYITVRGLQFVFIYLGIVSLVLFFFMRPLIFLPYLCWICTAAIGILIGKLAVNRMAVLPQDDKWVLKTGGSFAPILSFIGLTVAKFYFAIPIEWNIAILQSPFHQLFFYTLFGLFLGFAGGRWWYARQLVQLMRFNLGVTSSSG